MNFVPIGKVLAVCRNSQPGIPKVEQDHIRLIKDFGVEGDYHAGKTIRHRYLVRKDPLRPNHRQVLMIDRKIITDITSHNIQVKPGQLGENILISDIGLMKMPTGTVIQIGEAEIALTEVRHPCDQLNAVHPQLMNTVMTDKNDPTTFNAGMMGIILKGGLVRVGDSVLIKKPSG